MLNKDDTLLNELLSDDNLKIAKQRVKKNKGASGIDGMEVKELDEYLSKHIDEIKEQILLITKVIANTVFKLNCTHN